MDASGGPAVDPTQNVLDLVEAAIRRQDDLREAETRHHRELTEIRHQYEAELREAESKRIDAIRAVDVGAVSRAADVSAIQATTLAAQVQVSAETLRAAQSAATEAQTVALRTTVEPLIEAIADLRRAQYETQGGRSKVGETRLNLGAIFGGISLFLVLVFGVAGLIITFARG